MRSACSASIEALNLAVRVDRERRSRSLNGDGYPLAPPCDYPFIQGGELRMCLSRLLAGGVGRPGAFHLLPI